MRFGFVVLWTKSDVTKDGKRNQVATYKVWNVASEMFEQTDSVRVRVFSPGAIFGGKLLLML